MKVFLLTRIKLHPDRANPNAPQVGDIVELCRADRTHWGNEAKIFLPVLVDINIPCGDNFKQVDKGWYCGKCEYNHPDKCDCQKLIQPQESIFGDGKILKKRRYKVNIVAPSYIQTIIDKYDKKSKTEEATLLAWAKSNQFQIADILHDKAAD